MYDVSPDPPEGWQMRRRVVGSGAWGVGRIVSLHETCGDPTSHSQRSGGLNVASNPSPMCRVVVVSQQVGYQ